MSRNSSRLRRGATLVEVITASSISVLVLGVTIMTMISASAQWLRGQGRIDAETDAQSAVRIISQELREARQVVVDGNGQGITYQIPAKDADGNYAVPPVSDGIQRRIALVNGQLELTTGGDARVIARGVITTDPQTNNGAGTYRIFTAGAGMFPRQVTVQVVTRRLGKNNQQLTSRNRETIFLRNVPEVIQ